MIWAIWNGGGNYSRGHDESVETFESIEDACTEAENRRSCGHWFANTFRYVNRPEETALTPCVDESSTVEVYLSDPTDGEHIPDLVIEFDEETNEFRVAESGDYVTRPTHQSMNGADQ